MHPDLILRRATFAGGTFDRTARTVEAVLSAGADVQRRDVRGVYVERIAPAGLTVLGGNDRVPLLDNHRRDSIAHVLGYADNIRNDGGEVRALLHIADDRALSLIEAGSLTGTSIGFAPAADQWSEANGQRVRSITSAVLHEASLTEFPADPSATILRSDTMPPEIIDRAAINVQIRNLIRTASLPVEFADGLIDRSATIEQTRAAAFDEITRRGVHIPAHQTGPSGDDPSVIVTRMSAALAHRLGAPGELVAESAQYAGMGLHDMCRNLLAARGERVLSMSTEALLTRAIGTSDLPILLQSTGQRTLLGAYQAALSPVFQLARQTTANDFRTLTRVRLGEFAQLERVAEGGEIHHGGVAEESQSYQLATYAKLFSLTRQALINDDLGALGTISAAQGRAAAETQNSLIVALLVSQAGLGPDMSDDNPLFDASHGNVAGSGAAISTTTLDAGAQALRAQKGVDGTSPINAIARYLLVPPAKEFLARQMVASFYPATSATVNPLAGTLTVLVEPRLSGNRWYLFADPAILPILEYAYLSSAPGPQMESRPGWEVLGIEFRVVLDFGAGAIDWRGAYANAGA